MKTITYETSTGLLSMSIDDLLNFDEKLSINIDYLTGGLCKVTVKGSETAIDEFISVNDLCDAVTG